MRTREEALRVREKIHERAAERHKARDKSLPVGQRPVKRLWLVTAVFSANILLALFSTWRHRFALLGLLHYVLSAGAAPFHVQMWDLLSVFNVFTTPAVLVTYWMRHFQARAERQRDEEQRRAERALRGEGVWPPPPRV